MCAFGILQPWNLSEAPKNAKPPKGVEQQSLFAYSTIIAKADYDTDYEDSATAASLNALTRLLLKVADARSSCKAFNDYVNALLHLLFGIVDRHHLLDNLLLGRLLAGPQAELMIGLLQ